MAVKKNRWLFPTNTNNMRMIMAQGLLTSPEGFTKYYKDVLLDCDGYLPLFRHNKIPATSIEKSVSEAEYLVPCLLEFDLSKLSGLVTALINGKTKKVDLNLGLPQLEGDIEQLFIPLPMPLGCISKIIFKDKDDIDAFKKDAEIRSNVILGKIKLSSTNTEKKLFETTNPEFLFDMVEEIEEPKKPDYPTVYAYGGLLSLLFYHAKNGALSHQFFDDFSRNVIPKTNNLKEQVVPKVIYEYFHNHYNMDETRPENKILKGVLDSCIKSNDIKNSVINFLRELDWNDEKAKVRSSELADTLNNYASNSSGTVSEYFNNAKPGLEKVLLMLFTREDSGSFIDFQNSNIKFTESEYLLFAMFFGIRDGFIKVPPFIRKYSSLQEYISNRMAAYAHKKVDSNIEFKEMNLPKTVWQFVDKNPLKSTVELLDLDECFQTTMSAKNGFKHEKGKNIYKGLIVPRYEIIEEEYFPIISIKKITDTDYNKLK